MARLKYFNQVTKSWDYADASVIGGGSGEVTKEYVDVQDTSTLNKAKTYTNTEVAKKVDLSTYQAKVKLLDEMNVFQNNQLEKNATAIDEIKKVQVVVLGTNWILSGTKYTQTIALSGIKSTDRPLINVELSTNEETANQELEQYSNIFRVDSLEGQLKFTSNEPTTILLNIMVKGV